jgi:hypothetical protein
MPLVSLISIHSSIGEFGSPAKSNDGELACEHTWREEAEKERREAWVRICLAENMVN